MADQPDWAMWGKRPDEILAEQRALRAEWRDQARTLMEFHRSVTRGFERLNTRLDQLEDEFVTTLKMELGGRFADFETRTEERLERDLDQRLHERLTDLTERVEALERRQRG
jgi:DNA anti-recombination protein RmuC